MFPDSRVCASVCPGKVWGAGRARPRELVVWRAPAPLPRGLGGLGWGQNCTLLWAALPATVPGLEPRVPLLRRACLRGRGHTHSASRGPGRGAAAEAHAQCVRTWVFCTAECVTLAPPSLTLPVMEGKHSPQTAGVGTQQLVLRGVPFPSRAGGCPPSQPAPDGPPALCPSRSAPRRCPQPAARRHRPHRGGGGGPGFQRRRNRGAHPCLPAGRGGQRGTGHGPQHPRLLCR